MQTKKPIVDPDGRLWVWKRGQGYMPEPGADMYWRKAALRALRRSDEPNDMRHKIARAANGKCGLCGGSMGKFVTLDHVMPKSRGGKNHGNLIGAHSLCNSRKGGRLPTGCEKIWLMMVNANLGIDCKGAACSKAPSQMETTR